MAGWTIQGDAWLNADGAYALTYAEILNALIERSDGGWGYTPEGIKGVDVFYGYTTGIGIRSLQEWLCQMCDGDNFIKSHNPDGSKKSPSEFIGAPMEGRNTNPFTYWTFEEVINTASGNIGKTHFRRATESPENWTDYNDPAYSYGYAQTGDRVGPWLYVDLQRALSLLHWKYRYFDPYNYYAKYSGGCTFMYKQTGAQDSYTSLDAVKSQAVENWNSQDWTPGESTYSSKVNAYAQSWVSDQKIPYPEIQSADLAMEKVTYRFAVGSAAQSIMSMFISAWKFGSGTTDQSEFDSFGLGYQEGAANLIQTFDFSQSDSTDQVETQLLGDCPDPPGWPTRLYSQDGEHFVHGERGYILDNYAHCILDYVAGGKYIYY